VLKKENINQKWNPAIQPGYPADPSASVGMTGGRDSRHRRCDNCRFSIWMMSLDRPMLGCKQRAGRASQWWIVRLEQSCTNFEPSETFKKGAKAVRKIPLTQGKFALVDNRDYYRLVKQKWNAAIANNTFYAAGTQSRKSIKMHRFIMDAPAHLVVDHIDHNGLNNVRGNLRLCTFAQNARNIQPTKGTSSRYKGVCWKKKEKKWVANVQPNNKRYFLGYFDNEIDAAKAYDKKAAEVFGEFACLNFPPEAESSDKLKV
jgi:hypothetical protein